MQSGPVSVECTYEYANFNYGKREGDSLADFTRRYAFDKVDVPGYYVPLTAVGRLALP